MHKFKRYKKASKLARTKVFPATKKSIFSTFWEISSLQKLSTIYKGKLTKLARTKLCFFFQSSTISIYFLSLHYFLYHSTAVFITALLLFQSLSTTCPSYINYANP